MPPCTASGSAFCREPAPPMLSAGAESVPGPLQREGERAGNNCLGCDQGRRSGQSHERISRPAKSHFVQRMDSTHCRAQKRSETRASLTCEGEKRLSARGAALFRGRRKRAAHRVDMGSGRVTGGNGDARPRRRLPRALPPLPAPPGWVSASPGAARRLRGRKTTPSGLAISAGVSTSSAIRPANKITSISQPNLSVGMNVLVATPTVPGH